MRSEMVPTEKCAKFYINILFAHGFYESKFIFWGLPFKIMRQKLNEYHRKYFDIIYLFLF